MIKPSLLRVKKDRIIPINSKLFDMLRKRIPVISTIDQSNYVFEKCKGVIFRADTVSKCFKKAVREAKLDERIHIHTLRHSFASNLVQKGVSLYIVKNLCGHQSIITTQRYSHLKKESLEQAIALFD